MEPQLCQPDSDNLNVEWPVAVEVVWGTRPLRLGVDGCRTLQRSWKQRVLIAAFAEARCLSAAVILVILT